MNSKLFLAYVFFVLLSSLQPIVAQSSTDSIKVIDKYDLYKILRQKCPTGWLVAQREDKPGQPYFAISHDETYLVRSEMTYAEDPTQEEAWAKKNGLSMPYEICIHFEPYPYEAYKLTKLGVSMPPPVNPEQVEDLENKFGIKELAFDKDAGTYAAFSKDEKDRLVNFFLSKEHHSGQPVIVSSVAPTFYVKDYAVTIKYTYPSTEYRLYPKQVAVEVEKIEQIIKETLQYN